MKKGRGLKSPGPYTVFRHKSAPPKFIRRGAFNKLF